MLAIELKTAMAKQTNNLENVQFANPEATLPPFVIKQKRVETVSTASTHVSTNTGTQKQPYILLIVATTVSKGKQKYKLNCLFDTGSQRTYFSRQVIEKLGCYKYFLTPVEYVIKTFLGSKTKKLNQVVMGIEVNKGNSLPLPVLIDDEFDMNLSF